VKFVGRNAYEGHGAINIDGDATAPAGLSSDACWFRCLQDSRCSCVTFQPQTGKCWKRASCYEPGWANSRDFDVYLKKTVPSLPDGVFCFYKGGEHACRPGSSCWNSRQQCTREPYDYMYAYGAMDIDDDKSSGLSAQQANSSEQVFFP